MIVDAPTNLLAGNDYVLLAYSKGPSSPVTLKGPGGTVVITSNGDHPLRGVEFRAPRTAKYLIESDSKAASAWVEPDCRDGTATRCRIAVDHVRNGSFQWRSDADTFAARLTAGRSYVFTMTGFGGPPDYAAVLTLTDRRGTVIGLASGTGAPDATLAVRPPRTGTYYLEGRCAAALVGFSYILALRSE